MDDRYCSDILKSKTLNAFLKHNTHTHTHIHMNIHIQTIKQQHHWKQLTKKGCYKWSQRESESRQVQDSEEKKNHSKVDQNHEHSRICETWIFLNKKKTCYFVSTKTVILCKIVLTSSDYQHLMDKISSLLDKKTWRRFNLHMYKSWAFNFHFHRVLYRYLHHNTTYDIITIQLYSYLKYITRINKKFTYSP